jgi:hypothetical protein
MNSKSKNNLDLKMVGTSHIPHDGHAIGTTRLGGGRAIALNCRWWVHLFI